MPKQAGAFANRLKLLEIVGHVLTEPVYASAGRPKSGQQPDSYQYRIERVRPRPAWNGWRPTPDGRFILATNDLSGTPDHVPNRWPPTRHSKWLSAAFVPQSPEFLTIALSEKPERIFSPVDGDDLQPDDLRRAGALYPQRAGAQGRSVPT